MPYPEVRLTRDFNSMCVLGSLPPPGANFRAAIELSIDSAVNKDNCATYYIVAIQSLCLRRPNEHIIWGVAAHGMFTPVSICGGFSDLVATI